MSSTREIKRKLKSISSTAKITKTMQMVAASKMKSAQDRAAAVVPYTQGLHEIIRFIGELNNTAHPLLQSQKEIKSIAIVSIAPTRGFAGQLPSMLLLSASGFVEKMKSKFPGAAIHGIGIHKIAIKVLEKLELEIDFQFSDPLENPTTTDIDAITSVIRNGFMEKRYNLVYLCYPQFINTMVQEVVIKKLLPLSWKKIQEEEIEQTDNLPQEEQRANTSLFEPSRRQVLNRLLPEYFETQVFSALLDSIASEHSARMIAMKKATDNANEMIGALQLNYNKNRQASITNAMLEIAAGSITEEN